MITLGLILLIVGLLVDLSLVWAIGVALLAVGVVLWILGALGRAVGGRPHYY